MKQRNSMVLMWAQACDRLDQAERKQRQFFRLSASGKSSAVWEPPVDVFEDEREIVIVVALPGVAAEGIEISMDQGVLLVRAQRGLPFGSARRAVRRLEIPYGCFERRIALPGAELQVAGYEMRDGCLILSLHKCGGTYL